MSLRGDYRSSWKRFSDVYKKRLIMQDPENHSAENGQKVAKLNK